MILQNEQRVFFLYPNRSQNNNKKQLKQEQNKQKKDKLYQKVIPRFIFNKYQMKIHKCIFIFVFLISVIMFVHTQKRISTATKFTSDISLANDIQNLDHIKQSWFTIITRQQWLRVSHDLQWQYFRSNIFLILGMILFWGIVKFPRKQSWIFGLIITILYNRADSIIYFSILLFWYCYCRIFYKTRFFLILCWAIVIGLLYCSEKTDHFKSISEFIQQYIPQSLSFLKNSNRNLTFPLMLSISLLKLLSFSIDNNRGDETQYLRRHILKCQQCQPKKQIIQKQNRTQKVQVIDYCCKGRDLYPFTSNINCDFSFKNFMNYILFPPTLLAGPPISYKNFLSYNKLSTTKNEFLDMLSSFLNLIFLLITLDLYQHFFPVLKLTINKPLFIIQLTSLFDLMFIWFKFKVIWKIYRFWALIAGINVIDNLQRCIIHSCGVQGFLKMWHRGFNHWLIRYLYIPCGGNKNYFSVILTTLFASFWYIHSIQAILWGLTLALFIIPQLAIKRFFKNWENSPKLYKKHWFKYLCALLNGIYIYVFCLINIYRLGIGKEDLLAKIQENLLIVFFSILIVSQCSLIMFQLRDSQIKQKKFD